MAPFWLLPIRGTTGTDEVALGSGVVDDRPGIPQRELRERSGRPDRCVYPWRLKRPSLWKITWAILAHAKGLAILAHAKGLAIAAAYAATVRKHPSTDKHEAVPCRVTVQDVEDIFMLSLSKHAAARRSDRRKMCTFAYSRERHRKKVHTSTLPQALEIIRYWLK